MYPLLFFVEKKTFTWGKTFIRRHNFFRLIEEYILARVFGFIAGCLSYNSARVYEGGEELIPAPTLIPL